MVAWFQVLYNAQGAGITRVQEIRGHLWCQLAPAQWVPICCIKASCHNDEVRLPLLQHRLDHKCQGSLQTMDSDNMWVMFCCDLCDRFGWLVDGFYKSSMARSL